MHVVPQLQTVVNLLILLYKLVLWSLWSLLSSIVNRYTEMMATAIYLSYDTKRLRIWGLNWQTVNKIRPMTNLSKLRYQTIEILRLKLNYKIRHVTYFVKSFQVTSLSRGKLFIIDLPRNLSWMPSHRYFRRVAGFVDEEFCVGCTERPLR